MLPELNGSATRVTVFVPVFNAKKFLAETIESVLNQTFTDFELLDIDDGSTDRSIVIPKAKLWHKVSSSFGGSNSPVHAYFMTRNELIWAKKHLPHSVRTKLHKRSLDKVRHILFPVFSLITADLPLLKRLLWSYSSWLKTIKRNISNPANKAILAGLRDYYLGRFGDCPDQVRKLGKNS